MVQCICVYSIIITEILFSTKGICNEPISVIEHKILSPDINFTFIFFNYDKMTGLLKIYF